MIEKYGFKQSGVFAAAALAEHASTLQEFALELTGAGKASATQLRRQPPPA
jgi:hypothetical protein